jgi:hypothetical protein
MLWSQFSAILNNCRQKNCRFSQKPLLGSIFFKFSFVLSQKRQILKSFLAKIFLKHRSKIGRIFAYRAQPYLDKLARSSIETYFTPCANELA